MLGGFHVIHNGQYHAYFSDPINGGMTAWLPYVRRPNGGAQMTCSIAWDALAAFILPFDDNQRYWLSDD